MTVSIWNWKIKAIDWDLGQLNLLSLSLAGITGATIKIDANGDSEGNFSVLALKPSRENFSCNFQMVPVAYFQQGENPVSECKDSIWTHMS